MTAAPAIACLQRMPSRPIRNGLAHLGSASLCSVQQPACAMRRTVCRLRAITAAVTYVTQTISWKPRKSSGVLGYAPRPSYRKNVATNIGNKLFTLLSACFPANNKLYKIINKNTTKLSYSCMSNIKQSIVNNKKSNLSEGKIKEEQKKICATAETGHCAH